MAHEVTFIPGDGTGPELAEATRRVLEATGIGFDWDVQQAGIDEYERSGNPFPAATLDSLTELWPAVVDLVRSENALLGALIAIRNGSTFLRERS